MIRSRTKVAARLKRLAGDAEEIRLETETVLPMEERYLAYGRSFGLIDNNSELKESNKPYTTQQLLIEYSRLLAERGNLSSAKAAALASIEVHREQNSERDQKSYIAHASALRAASQIVAQTPERDDAQILAAQAVEVANKISEIDVLTLREKGLAHLNLSNQFAITGQGLKAIEQIDEALRNYQLAIDFGDGRFHKDIAHVLRSKSDLISDEHEKSKLFETAMAAKERYDDWFDSRADNNSAQSVSLADSDEIPFKWKGSKLHFSQASTYLASNEKIAQSLWKNISRCAFDLAQQLSNSNVRRDFLEDIEKIHKISKNHKSLIDIFQVEHLIRVFRSCSPTLQEEMSEYPYLKFVSLISDLEIVMQCYPDIENLKLEELHAPQLPSEFHIAVDAARDLLASDQIISNAVRESIEVNTEFVSKTDNLINTNHKKAYVLLITNVLSSVIKKIWD